MLESIDIVVSCCLLGLVSFRMEKNKPWLPKLSINLLWGKQKYIFIDWAFAERLNMHESCSVDFLFWYNE